MLSDERALLSPDRGASDTPRGSATAAGQRHVESTASVQRQSVDTRTAEQREGVSTLEAARPGGLLTREASDLRRPTRLIDLSGSASRRCICDTMAATP